MSTVSMALCLTLAPDPVKSYIRSVSHILVIGLGLHVYQVCFLWVQKNNYRASDSEYIFSKLENNTKMCEYYNCRD